MQEDLFPSDTPKADLVQPRFIAVDFFCGAGGTTRGMIDAGGYVIGGVDKEEICRTTYMENNVNTTLDGAKAEFINRDIFSATPEYPEGEQRELVADLDMRIQRSKAMAPEAPLMFAICAPCQPFTSLSRKTLSKDRAAGRERDRQLLLEAGNMVAKFKPEIVVAENVAGARRNSLGNIWGEFEALLDGLGYVVGSEIVSTEKFGIAQARRRSILVGIRKDKIGDAKIARITLPEADANAMPVTVEDAIGKYPPLKDGDSHPAIPNHRTAKLSDLNRRRISHARPGASNDYLFEVDGGAMALDCHKNAAERNNGRHKTFTDVYTRMDPKKPSPTITTNCHSISNGRFGHYDPKQNRGISLREAAALQSFEDDYVFYPEERTGPAARMIGNAVPPKLSKFFSEFALGLLKQQ